MTMLCPPLQWSPEEQYSQTGSVSFIRMLKTWLASSLPLAVKKPEKMPLSPSRGWQGLSKLDCATEWLLAKKWKLTRSPGEAVRLSGSNFRPSAPTFTSQVLVAGTPVVPVAEDEVVDELSSA